MSIETQIANFQERIKERLAEVDAQLALEPVPIENDEQK